MLCYDLTRGSVSKTANSFSKKVHCLPQVYRMGVLKIIMHLFGMFSLFCTVLGGLKILE